MSRQTLMTVMHRITPWWVGAGMGGLLLLLPVFPIQGKTLPVSGVDASPQAQQEPSQVRVDTIYRIQIIAGRDSQTVSRAQQNFSDTFPEMKAKVYRVDTLFKLWVGEYQSRSEAREPEKTIQGVYPNAFIITQFIRDTLSSQPDTAQVPAQDTVTVIRKIVVKKRSEGPKKERTIYSVQLTISSDSMGAIRAQQQFRDSFPGVNTYIAFIDSFYKLRAGIYRTRKEAEQRQGEFRQMYKKAFVVEDQRKVSIPEVKGIKVIQPKKLDTLLAKYKSINQENAQVKRYRVQIISSGNKKKVMKEKAEFLKKFPDKEPVDVDYKGGYFKLRVGNFRDIWKAQESQREINQQFKGTFLIQEYFPLSKIRDE